MNLENIKNQKYILNVIIFLIIVFLIIMKRPDIITNAQPWAEDGRFWLQDAYNNGIFNTLFMPENGYFQTISRLTYSLALLFNLSKTDLLTNIISLLIGACFIAFILSNRVKFIPLVYRAIVAFYVLLAKNISEVYPNMTSVKCRWKKYGLLRVTSS